MKSILSNKPRRNGLQRSAAQVNILAISWVMTVGGLFTLGSFAHAGQKPVKLITRRDPSTGITTVFPKAEYKKTGLVVSWSIRPEETFDEKGKRTIEIILGLSFGVRGPAFAGRVIINADGTRTAYGPAMFNDQSGCDIFGSCHSVAAAILTVDEEQLKEIVSSKVLYFTAVGTGVYAGEEYELNVKGKGLTEIQNECDAILSRKSVGLEQ